MLLGFKDVILGFKDVKLGKLEFETSNRLLINRRLLGSSYKNLDEQCGWGTSADFI